MDNEELAKKITQTVVRNWYGIGNDDKRDLAGSLDGEDIKDISSIVTTILDSSLGDRSEAARWIPVSERLPGYADYVHIAFPWKDGELSEEIDMGVYCEGEWYFTPWKGSLGVEPNVPVASRFGEVTHWMPLVDSPVAEFSRTVTPGSGRGAREMKVYVLVDHVCEADVVVGVFSTAELAQAYIDQQQQKDWKLRMEGPEIYEFALCVRGDSGEEKP